MIKRLKSIPALILVFTMLLIPVSSTVSYAQTDYSVEVEFLSGIGVKGLNVSVVNGTLTRSEAAIMLAEALGMKEEAVENQKLFSDMETDHSASKVVCYLWEKGIINGNSDGTFRPDANVTYNEFIKMAVVSIGYRPYAEVTGSFVTGYMSSAQKAGLLKGVKNDGEFTKGDAYKLLYNILHVNQLIPDAVVTDGKTGSVNATYVEGDPLLYQIYGYRRYEGVVHSTANGAIYGEDFLSEGMIMINYTNYRYLSPSLKDYLGLNVHYYLNDRDEVAFVVPYNNTKHVLFSDVIDSKTTKNIIYYEDGDKIKEYTVAKDAFYSYNGVQIVGPKNSDLKPYYGKLELIENNGDNKIDVVKIWDYKNYITTSVTNSRIFVDENNEGIQFFNLDDNNCRNILLNSAGLKVEFNILDKDCVITVAETKNKNLRTFIMATNNFEGTITELTSKNKAVIDDYEYNVYGGVNLNEYLGVYALFYLDVNDTIIKAEVTDSTKIGVLHGVMQTGGLDSKSAINIYANNNFTEYAIEDGIRLSVGGENLRQYKASEAYKIINDAYITSGRQLIKYELEGEKLKKLILAKKSADRNDRNDDLFMLNYDTKDYTDVYVNAGIDPNELTYKTYREYIVNTSNGAQAGREGRDDNSR